MFEIAAQGLQDDESQHLAIATAAKLMELARYRPYEPDAADCRFIRAALPFARKLTSQNRKELEWYVTATAARLVGKGMIVEAFALTPPKSYPFAIARLLLARH